jgi:hypothetical protein
MFRRDLVHAASATGSL